MRKKSIHKVFSVTMAFLVLVSTMSFTLEKHFCGDILIDVAVFSESVTCGMDMETASNLTADKKSCCKDEVEIVRCARNALKKQQ